jgi:hypothetical protein
VPSPLAETTASKARLNFLAAVEHELDDTDLATQPLEARLASVHWGISIELERRLAQDPSAKVRFKLADSRHPRKCGRSPNIDAEALRQLQADKSAKIRAAAAHLTPYPKGKRPPP